MRPWTVPTMTLALALSAVAAARGDPATQPADAGHLLESSTLVDIDVSHLPLEQALAKIKQRIPAFRYVVFRGPRVPDDYPVLPAMSLDGVGFDQFAMLVTDALPGVTMKRLHAAGPNPVYEITIKPTPDQYLTSLQPGEGVRPGADPLALMPPRLPRASAATAADGLPTPLPTTSPPPTDVPVHVYRLSDIVDLLAMRKVYPQGRIVNGLADAGLPPAAVADAQQAVGAADKQAVKDVLSLVQAALRTSGENQNQVSLEVHEPTQTLIFRGDAEAQAVLEETLKTLRPTEQEAAAITAWRAAADNSDEATLISDLFRSQEAAETNILRGQVEKLQQQLTQAGQKPPHAPDSVFH